MAEYTVPLSDVINTYNVDVEGIALTLYPIFDETYRASLNYKIIHHYWYREIGVESIDAWLYNLAAQMNEMMPFFNQYYLSEQIKFDPLSTYKLSELTESDSLMNDKRAVNQSGNSTSSSDNNTRSSNFDGPNVQLSDTGDYVSDKVLAESSTAATGVTDSTESASGQAEASGTSRHDVSGRIGDSAELLRSYRRALLNIDMMVVEGLSPLFMAVWNMGDSTFRKAYNYGYLYPAGFIYP